MRRHLPVPLRGASASASSWSVRLEAHAHRRASHPVSALVRVSERCDHVPCVHVRAQPLGERGPHRIAVLGEPLGQRRRVLGAEHARVHPGHALRGEDVHRARVDARAVVRTSRQEAARRAAGQRRVRRRADGRRYERERERAEDRVAHLVQRGLARRRHEETEVGGARAEVGAADEVLRPVLRVPHDQRFLGGDVHARPLGRRWRASARRSGGGGRRDAEEQDASHAARYRTRERRWHRGARPTPVG